MGLNDDLAMLRRMLGGLAVPPIVTEAIMRLVAVHAPASAAAARRPSLDIAPPNETAAMLHALSLARAELLGPGLGADAAWNMMLMLYTHADDAEPLDAAELCAASGTTDVVALRYLRALEARALVTRRATGAAPHRALIDLSPEAHARMTDLIAAFCVRPLPARLLPR